MPPLARQLPLSPAPAHTPRAISTFWGNMAVRYGVYTKPNEGVIFGGRWVTTKPGANYTFDHCFASYGPEKAGKLNSA